MNHPTQQQVATCNRFGSLVELPDPADKLGIALQTLDRLPLTAVRHKPAHGTCGWYIWGGDYSDANDFYQPMHVTHLAEHCPQLLPFLTLAPGWCVMLSPAYEDVWFEEWRTQ